MVNSIILFWVCFSSVLMRREMSLMKSLPKKTLLQQHRWIHQIPHSLRTCPHLHQTNCVCNWSLDVFLGCLLHQGLWFLCHPHNNGGHPHQTVCQGVSISLCLILIMHVVSVFLCVLYNVWWYLLKWIVLICVYIFCEICVYLFILRYQISNESVWPYGKHI